jgi:hypothetical protein
MNDSIQLEIEGEGAIAATEELFTLPDIQGQWEAVGGDEREGVLATIATIIGIVGGSMAIAEQLRKWYQAYAKGQKPGGKIEKVLIVGRNGRRLLLKDATVEQIRQILNE